MTTDRPPAPRAANADAPQDFGALLDELRTLRESVALLPFALRRRFSLSGADARDYLHRRLTQSILNLPEEGGRQALLLDGRGRMQADLLVYALGDRIDLLADADRESEARELLERFILMEEARVDAPVDRETSVALAGPAAPLLVAGLIGESAVAPWIARERVLVRDCPCRLYGDARRGASLFHVTMESDDRDSVVEELLDRCRARGGGRAGAAAWDFHRIESGLTRHGIDTDAETVPLDAALNGAVDFKKGCFPGQETLAKIRNLGHPARVLVRLNVEGDVEIERGAAILGEDTEEPIGEATSSRSIPSLGRTAALGFLKWRFRDVARAKIVTREGDPAQAELERVG